MKNINANTLAPTTNACATTTSSPGQSKAIAPPSAPAVARPCSTLDANDENVLCLLVITSSLLREMLSGDAMWLALNSARTKALKAGISEERFQYVGDAVIDHWIHQRGKNPLSGMF